MTIRSNENKRGFNIIYNYYYSGLIMSILFGSVIAFIVLVDRKISILTNRLNDVEKYIDKIDKIVNNEGIFIKDYIKYKEHIKKEKNTKKHLWI